MKQGKYIDKPCRADAFIHLEEPMITTSKVTELFAFIQDLLYRFHVGESKFLHFS